LVYDGICSDLLIDTLTINVLPPLTLLPQHDGICVGETANVGVQVTGGTGGPYTIAWDNGFTGSPQPIPGLLDDTSYLVDVSDGCSSASSTVVYVDVNPSPDVGFTVSGGTCEAAVFKIRGILGAVPIASWYWDFGDGNFSTDPDSAVHVYTSAGIYDITLIVTSDSGCADTVFKPAEVNAYVSPNADFVMTQNGVKLNPHVTTMLSPTIDFVNTSSSNVDSVIWDFGDEASGAENTSNDLNPIHMFSDAGTYTITLTVYTSEGCMDIIVQELVIEGEYILFAPNAFTPDGDGFNDFFLPKGVGITGEDFDLVIYNRWGDLIREVSGVFSDDVTAGWDGRANNGNGIVQMDVYVWVIHTRDSNGGKHQYIGHITLLQ
jgi:gliding motility-associated-like protein